MASVIKKMICHAWRQPYQQLQNEMNVVDILQDKKNFIFMQHLLKVLCHICDVVI